jgi:uncharacterized SAM-binding protein YcdF (DUF218 family)
MDLAIFSRITGTVFTASNFLPLLLVMGVLLQWTAWRRLGRGLVIAVAASFLLIYFLPIDQWLRAPLEDRFSRPPWPAHVDGVIVLAGGQDRLMTGAEVARRYPHARLIYSGGVAPFEKPEMSEANVARAAFEQMGVAPSQLTLETRSRNTWESFVYSKELARPRPDETWLVVTAPIHMPRAMGVAARVHWHVLPWPSGYAIISKGEGVEWDSSIAERLVEIESGAHEWTGLAAYRLMGRIGETAK